MDGLKVLLVEDNPGDARLFREYLRPDGPGVTIRWEDCLAGGLSVLGEERPNVIVADLGLPDSEGVETVRRFNEAAPNTPLVVLTGGGDMERALAAQRAGATEYLQKEELGPELVERTLRWAVERAGMEDKIRQREAQFRNLAETIPGVVFQFRIRPDGRYDVSFVSEQVDELLGLGSDDDVFQRLIEQIPPAYRTQVRDSIDIAADNCDVWRQEFPYEKPSGYRIWLLGTASPEQREDALIYSGVFLDISELKRAQQQRNQSHRQLELLFELTPLALAVSSREGMIQEINRAFEREFGYAAEEVIGQRADEIDIWNDYSDRSAILQTLGQEGEVRRFPTTFLTGSGEQREVEVSVTELPATGPSQLVWAIRDVTQRNQYERELERQARFDSVTGLPNRYLIMDRLEHAVTRVDQREEPLAVIFVDLDEFKAINDEFGHAAGDKLLRVAGDRMVATVREEDTVGRLSGDEFVVILEGMNRDGAEAVAKRLLGCFREDFEIASQLLSISASVGVVVRDADSPDLMSAEDLIQASDAAMYEVKKDASKRFYVFGAADKENQRYRVRRRARLRQAIEDDELILYYQPVIRLSDGSIVGTEALIRWDHPEEGVIAPSEFIPFAEEVGLIGAVDQWVVEEACRQGARWQEADLGLKWISVNASAHRERDRDFQDEVLNLLDRHDFPGHFLQLEITERLALHSTRPFERLRGAGIRLAIDDFGTGYSSLLYLRHIDAEVLKIDPFFIDDLENSDRTAAILRSIVHIADVLDIEVIAEGVETQKQHAHLQEIGCDYAQGYVYARPQPPDKAGRIIQEEISLDHESET